MPGMLRATLTYRAVVLGSHVMLTGCSAKSVCSAHTLKQTWPSAHSTPTYTVKFSSACPAREKVCHEFYLSHKKKRIKNWLVWEINTLSIWFVHIFLIFFLLFFIFFYFHIWARLKHGFLFFQCYNALRIKHAWTVKDTYTKYNVEVYNTKVLSYSLKIMELFAGDWIFI